MKPKYRFTLNGDLGPYQISEPEGWASIIFNLERDESYWSLIENFELPLVFYGVAQGRDGGYDYLKRAIQTGLDTTVTLLCEIKFDGAYETCFDGRIDLSTSKEIVFRAKIQAAIVRNDLWSVFMAKRSTPVNLFSTIDIYGGSRDPINKQELILPSQKLFKQHNSQLATPISYYCSDVISGKYLQTDTDTTILDEIKEKFTYPNDVNAAIPVNLFSLEEPVIINLI